MSLNAGAQMKATAAPAAYVPSNCNVQHVYGKRPVTIAQLSATVATGGFSQWFTYTSAVSSPLGVGVQLARINLSARTGYTASAMITIKFTKDRDVCGTTGYPANTPGRIVVRPVGSS